MQKLITVSVNTKLLSQSAGKAFTINEVDSINELLQQGWEIEEWDFLKEGTSDGEILLLVILNDNQMFDEDDEMEEEFDFDDDDDDDEDDDDEMDGLEEKKNF